MTDEEKEFKAFESILASKKDENGNVGRYQTEQKRLSLKTAPTHDKNKEADVFPTCWLRHLDTQEEFLGVLDRPGHIKIVEGTEARNYKFVKKTKR